MMVVPDDLANADGDPFMGRIVGGRFAILARLGAGSTGTVYRARQLAVGREVAIKIVRADQLVDAQAKGRFRQEARATSLLRSPHTVTMYDFGEINVEEDLDEDVDGSLYLAMELLDGESLGDRLKRMGPMPFDEAVTVVRHTLLSLMEAHEKGIIHRDLKPDNLLLVRGPLGGAEVCKVLDFGIAKLLIQEGGVDALETQAGTVFGTPRYMSPEQAQGKALDARSDLYALGVILYHMLVGRPPYMDNDAVVVMAHHIKTPPPRPCDALPERPLPRDLEKLLMQILEKNPDKRPQNASAFLAALDDLEPFVDEVPTDINAVLAGRPRIRPSSRWILASAVLGVVAVIGFARMQDKTQRAMPIGSEVVQGSQAGGRSGAATAPRLGSAHSVGGLAVSATASATASAVPAVTVEPHAGKRPPKPRSSTGYRRFDLR